MERYGIPEVKSDSRRREGELGERKPQQKRDFLHEASIRLDGGLIRIMPYLSREDDGHPRLVIPEPNLERAATHAEFLHRRAFEQLRRVETSDHEGETTWNSYYRLLGQICTAQIRHQAEMAMMLIDERQTRKNMVDGIVGIHVGIAEHALEQFNIIKTQHLPQTKDKEERRNLRAQLAEIRGVISEHTIFALLNYEQSPDRYAIIPMLYQDLYKKTDALYYYQNGENAFKVPIQIKTTRRGGAAKSTPANGILIALSDFLPDREDSPDETTDDTTRKKSRSRKVDSTYLAELLIKQHRPERLTETEEGHLVTALALIHETMDQLLAKQPGLPLPVLKEMPIRKRNSPHAHRLHLFRRMLDRVMHSETSVAS